MMSQLSRVPIPQATGSADVGRTSKAQRSVRGPGHHRKDNDCWGTKVDRLFSRVLGSPHHDTGDVPLARRVPPSKAAAEYLHGAAEHKDAEEDAKQRPWLQDTTLNMRLQYDSHRPMTKAPRDKDVGALALGMAPTGECSEQPTHTLSLDATHKAHEHSRGHEKVSELRRKARALTDSNRAHLATTETEIEMR